MGARLAELFCEPREQGQRSDGSDAIIDREHDADPVAALIISSRGRVRRAKEILRDHRRGVDPHDEQRRPAEKLRDGELFHHWRHSGEIADNRAEDIIAAARLGHGNRDHAGEPVEGKNAAEQIDFFLQPELRDGKSDRRTRRDPQRTANIRAGSEGADGDIVMHLFAAVEPPPFRRAIFFGQQHRAEHGNQQRHAAEPEAIFDSVRDRAGAASLATPNASSIHGKPSRPRPLRR